MKKLFIAFAVLICLSAAAVLIIHKTFRPVSYNRASFAETSEIYDNPFRGFYHIYGFTLSEDDPAEISKRVNQYIQSGDLPLMLIQINLKNYSGSPLSDNALKQLDNVLSATDKAARQVILRFLYDWDGKAAETEPDDISVIMEHMKQIAPVVNRFSGSVFLIQGTFAGNCGEMNATSFGSHDDNRTLITQLSEVISPAIYLSVRTPSQLRGVIQSRTPVSADTAYNGSLGSRLGLFNDGMLGSVYDLGTYDDTSFAHTSQPEDKGTRSEEIAFQDDICRYVPNGGEAVVDNPYNDLDNAVSDMSKMHITYLNCDHDATVMDKWKSSIYRSNDCFDGMSGYDYIDAHLGYRYNINDVSVSSDITGRHIDMSLSIRNSGFAPSYRLFDSSVCITDENGNVLLSFPSSFDNRTLQSNETKTFTVSADISSLGPGTYGIYYSMTEPYSSQPVRFANVCAGGGTGVPEGAVCLGDITVGKASLRGFFSSVLSHLQNR